MVEGVRDTGGRGAGDIHMLAAVMFKGRAQIKCPQAMLGPGSTRVRADIGNTQLARGVDGVGIEVEREATEAVPSRDEGRRGGGWCPEAKVVECQLSSGEQEVPEVSRVGGVDRSKNRHDVVFSGLDSTFSSISSVIVRGGVGHINVI